jgi:hypothetical protein
MGGSSSRKLHPMGSQFASSEFLPASLLSVLKPSCKSYQLLDHELRQLTEIKEALLTVKVCYSDPDGWWVTYTHRTEHLTMSLEELNTSWCHVQQDKTKRKRRRSSLSTGNDAANYVITIPRKLLRTLYRKQRQEESMTHNIIVRHETTSTSNNQGVRKNKADIDDETEIPSLFIGRYSGSPSETQMKQVLEQQRMINEKKQSSRSRRQ